MTRQPREITQRHLEYIACAISRLEVAREFLRLAGAVKSADYVARAAKSAQGARRHAEALAERQTGLRPVRPNVRWGPFCVYGTRLGQRIFVGYANTESEGQGIARVAVGKDFEQAEVWHRSSCVWSIARPDSTSSEGVQP